MQTTVLYFLIDLVWVARTPICVKSPGIIVKVSFMFAVSFESPSPIPTKFDTPMRIDSTILWQSPIYQHHFTGLNSDGSWALA